MITITTAPAGQERTLHPVAQVVADELRRLQPKLLKDDADAVGKAARLRRGAGKDPVVTPDLWGSIDLAPLFEEDSGIRGANLERAERAVYGALALWALHQQSKGDPMHTNARGHNLGAAVRSLMPVGEIDDQVRKRFVRAGTAPNFAQLLARLRAIVQLLRREGVVMDYVELASQLYQWQQPGGAVAVRQAWGRGFHAHRPANQPNGSPAGAAESTKKENS